MGILDLRRHGMLSGGSSDFMAFQFREESVNSLNSSGGPFLLHSYLTLFALVSLLLVASDHTLETHL
jgi:hypothetical protein